MRRELSAVKCDQLNRTKKDTTVGVNLNLKLMKASIKREKINAIKCSRAGNRTLVASKASIMKEKCGQSNGGKKGKKESKKYKINKFND